MMKKIINKINELFDNFNNYRIIKRIKIENNINKTLLG